MKRSLIIIGVLSLCHAACGGGGLFTVPATPALSGITSTGAKVLSLASNYPAGLMIPDIDGLRNTAFIVSIENPVGLLAVALDGETLALSSAFAGCILPPGTGVPTGGAAILDAHRALVLTSSHLILCDPTVNETTFTLALPQSVTLTEPAALSRPYDVDDDGTPETTLTTVPLTYPANLAVNATDVYISFSNYIVPTGNPVAAPGIVLPVKRTSDGNGLQVDGKNALRTTGFNPTGLLLTSEALLMVNSGVNTIYNAGTKALTESGIDIVSLSTKTREWIPLGKVALAFHNPALTPDARYLFLTSASYGELYSIDLWTRTVLYDHAAPVVITGSVAGADFLPAAAFDLLTGHLYVASFATSALYPVAIAGSTFTALPESAPAPYVLGYPAGVTPQNPSGSNTGIGDVAIRPGTGFTGPNLFALTASPGQLIGITTQDGVVESIVPPPPPPPPPPTATAPAGGSGGAPAYSYTPPADSGPVTSGAQPVHAMSGSTLPYADSVVAFFPGTNAGYGLGFFPANVIGPPNATSTSTSATPPPNDRENDILSLGCNGTIVLAMTDFWIADGDGADFIVFENVLPGWTEPGIVGVSNDGIAFVDFPCNTATPPYQGCAGRTPTWTAPDNAIDPTDPLIAGGDAFDLADVGLSLVRYVRIRDGLCKNLGGNTTGFDLDAISVVWGISPTGKE
ncbi:MAG: hypothetical protein HYV02_00285 [Deltaproteobacteria bacterium]|nr:hypothetical protein [Deltaproteobacteria bacterium]